MLLLTLSRSAVLTLIKTSESGFCDRIAAMYTLDDELSRWWCKLPSHLRLTPSDIAKIPHGRVPNTLLLNVVYHQSIVALHASIVPLFCWSTTNNPSSYSTARLSSAQVAFEHACAISALLEAVLSSHIRLGAIHTFVAYAAYSGCAIQIPFMWCLNLAVKQRTTSNVRANVNMIRGMAPFWKLAAYLVRPSHLSHVSTLLTVPLGDPLRVFVQYT
jgi:hypothetical protein